MKNQWISRVLCEMACLMKHSQNAAGTWLFSFQHVLLTCLFSRVTLLANFSWASCETALIFISCLILYQINTKPNTIKSYKIQGIKLKQIQHFLSWNKANIKHSCKSQLYNDNSRLTIIQGEKPFYKFTF